LNENEGRIAVCYKDVVVKVDITQIEKGNLRLHYKSKAWASAIVTTNSGEVMRFEGYEDLDTLANALERLTPTDRVAHAKFYHR
jgi:hypothetical protein